MKLVFCAFLLFAIFICNSCKKSNTTEDQLPPETATGAMTFGCKVDGKVFVPKDGKGQPGLFVEYVYLGNIVDGGWHLNIPAVNWTSTPIESVHIESDSLLVIEGMNYIFKKSKGNVQAFYYKGIEYDKLDSDYGELKITKFDQAAHILSGTFFFTGTSSSGAKVNITDGRFDVRY